MGCRKKRLEARQTTDSFILKILATDENPVIRSLAFCNPHMPPEQLGKVGRGENQWYQMIAANNVSTPKDVLDKLVMSENFDIRRAAINNPNTSEVTLYKLKIKRGDNF